MSDMPNANTSEQSVLDVATGGFESREDIWAHIAQRTGTTTLLELGVWKGQFAEHILKTCPTISRYFMLDPWRHLEDWNKPFNVAPSVFEEIFSSAMARTDFAGDRRTVLRGKTTDMIHRIPDAALDIAYIDGDHTLRGIAIDLILTYPKVRPGGILGGDDFTQSIWQHADTFEPSLVCPFAAYFAESQAATIILLPYNQFAIIKPQNAGATFRLIDTTHRYGTLSLLPQITRRG